jgi:hypothetical protein
MKISIKYKVAKEIIAINPKIDNILSDYYNYDYRRTYRNNEEGFEKLHDDLIHIDLINFDKKKISDFIDMVKDLDQVPTVTKNVLNLWLKNLNNPREAKITSLNLLEKTLVTVFKDNKRKWIAKQNQDGMIVPYVVTKVKFYNRTRGEASYLAISLSYIFASKGSDWRSESDAKKEKKSLNISFYKEDIGEEDEISFDEENGDEEVKVKKQKGVSLQKLLQQKGIFLIEDKEIKNFEDQLERAHELGRKIGKMLFTNSKVYSIPDSKNGYASWRQLNQDTNVRSKLVVDYISKDGAISNEKTDQFGDVEVPEHPYVFCYNISQYDYSIVHVDNLQDYIYDEKIIEKLVLPKQKKKILSSLISNENNFEDIVSGKSGGIIILSTGEPGVGKTLTAEVYSELMKKPLYSIQSSQLGISVLDIESNLNKILYRAEKWGAILLIDEADAYIYKRGNDILQNCIVGTFLRLLEYYNGVLFLTSNRPEIIDDAIMSRVTLHIKFEKPTEEEFHQLWSILSENMSLTLESNLVDKLLTTYEIMSGRDIRNLLKNIKKCFSESSEVKFEMIEELEDMLPFIERKNTFLL